MIKPDKSRLYSASVHKVRPMYRPKFYLAAMKIQGKIRLLRDNRRFKTFTAAYMRSEKVFQRWCQFCDWCEANPLPGDVQEPTAK